MPDTLRYLCERQIGYSTSLLGFPNLADCMALVLQNDGGLFGMHLIGGDQGGKKFAEWIGQHSGFIQDPKWNAMYVAGFFAKRYGTGQDGDLSSEVAALAKALGYRGDVLCYDTVESGLPTSTTDSIYVHFQRTGATSVQVHYKRSSKLNTVSGPGVASSADHGEITGIGKQTLASNLGYQVTSVTGKVSLLHSGKMHVFKGPSKTITVG
ncbi:hypothetical protein [Viridibacterium curvum]|uniref:Uncharacterized protein n=1 Tax=Viridibacterium curvum TaxID=1101404 RepID=A0ABP9QQP6_9RHOO